MSWSQSARPWSACGRSGQDGRREPRAFGAVGQVARLNFFVTHTPAPATKLSRSCNQPATLRISDQLGGISLRVLRSHRSNQGIGMQYIVNATTDHLTRSALTGQPRSECSTRAWTRIG